MILLLGFLVLPVFTAAAFILGWCLGRNTADEIERELRDIEFGEAGAYDPLPADWARRAGPE